MAKSEYALKRLAQLRAEPPRPTPKRRPTLQPPRVVEDEDDHASRFLPKTGKPFRRPDYIRIIYNPAYPPRIKLHGFAPWRRPAHILPLDQLRAIGDTAMGSGIYFLWRRAELLYVGQSVEVPTRLETHRRCRDGFLRGKAMAFDRATSMSCPAEAMTKLEYEYICTYGPPLNDKWCP